MKVTKSPRSIGSSRVTLLMVLFGTLAMGGCRTLPLDLADRATSELKIPVFLWAYNDDECAIRNLTTLYDEYNDLSARAERRIEDKLSEAYSAIIINATEPSGTVTGVIRRIQLRDASNRRRVLESRQFADLRRTDSSHFPGVEVTKGHELTIQSYQGEDESETETYTTTDRAVYNVLNRDTNLSAALDAGRIVKVSSVRNRSESTCGSTLRLSDLF